MLACPKRAGQRGRHLYGEGGSKLWSYF